MSKIEKLFNVLRGSIESNNSDRIPSTIKEINLLLTECFVEHDFYSFACIINNYITYAKLIHGNKDYEKLAMLFDISSNATLNLIKILEEGYDALLPSIIFNQCDLSKQCQTYELDLSGVARFKKAVYKCLKEEFDFDVESLLRTSNVYEILNKHLMLEMNDNKMFNVLTGLAENNYLEDVFIFSVEYMLLTNKAELYAKYIVELFNKVNMSKYLDVLEITNTDFVRVPLLLSFKTLKNCAQHNGVSALELGRFMSVVYKSISSNPESQLYDEQTKLNGVLLYSKPECFGNLLYKITREIADINLEVDIVGCLDRALPKMKSLLEEVVAHCVLAMHENDANKFAQYIGDFVDVLYQSPHCVRMMFSGFFFLKYKGDKRLDEIFNNKSEKDFKQIFCWYLINSDDMNLLKMAKNGQINFKQYQNFKLEAYRILFPENQVLESNIDIYILLQDACELKDNQRYAKLIGVLKDHVVKLWSEPNKQVEIIKLLKLANDKEFAVVFDALESTEQHKIHNVIVDTTLMKMSVYLPSVIRFANTVFIKDKLSISLWNKSNARSDYCLDMEEFRAKVYKSSGFSDDNVKSFGPLNNFSYSEDNPWSDGNFENIYPLVTKKTEQPLATKKTEQPSENAAIKMFNGDGTARNPSHLEFPTWYHAEVCQYLLHTSDNLTRYIRVIFHDADAGNNTDTFQSQFETLKLLSVRMNKPAVFIAKEPGSNNHFICGILNGNQLLIINPVGISSHVDLYRTLAVLQNSSGLNILISNHRLQRSEYEPDGLVSCDPISIEVAMHVLANVTVEELNNFFANVLIAQESTTHQTNVVYFSTQISALLPATLLCLVDSNTQEDYQAKIKTIRRKHSEQLKTLPNLHAQARGITVEKYLEQCIDAPSQVVFNALFLRNMEILNIQEHEEYKLLEKELNGQHSEIPKIYDVKSLSEELTKEELPTKELTGEELANSFDVLFESYKSRVLLELKDYKEITKNRAIRRRLLDYTEATNIPDKCAAIIRADVEFLMYAYEHNMQAKIYYLLGFGYKKIKLTDRLFVNNSSQQLIILCLLQHLDFSSNSFYLLGNPEREISALAFKKEIFRLLELNNYDSEFEKLKGQLLQQDTSQLQDWLYTEGKVIKSYMLYCEDSNIHKPAWIQFVRGVVDYLNIPGNRQAILSQHTIKTKAFFAVLSLYYLSKDHKNNIISLEMFLNNICDTKVIRMDGLFPEDLALIKQSFNNLGIPSMSVEKISQLFNSFTLSSKVNGINLDMIARHIMMASVEDVFIDAVRSFNHVSLANSVITFVNNLTRIISEVKKDCFIEPWMTQDNFTTKQLHLLARNNVRGIYKDYENNLQYKTTAVANHKTYEFLRNVYTVIAEKFNKLNSSEQLMLELQNMQVEDTSSLHQASLECCEILEDAYLANDVKNFSKIANDAADFLKKLYQDGKKREILVCLKSVKSEDLHVIFRYLETGHLQAVKRWIINYYVANYSLSKTTTLSFFMLDSKIEKQKEEFKKQCYEELSIEVADAIDPRIEKISDQNVDTLFASIRTLANKDGIKIQTYEAIIEYLSKKYNVGNKPELYPTDADSKTYHVLYKTMQAIWHCFIAGHVFAVLIDDIKINDFKLKWEGAYDGVMLEYLKERYLEIIKKLDAAHHLAIDGIQAELIENFQNAILPKQEDSSKWLDDRLQTDKIIAIDVSLYDGGNSGHAVSAVFWKDLVLFANRGVSILDELSGIGIFKINKPETRKKIISELINSKKVSIASKAYKALKDQLNLQPLHQIAMFPQLKSNCSFSSSAEPIHLGIVFLCCLQEFIKTKNLQDACSLAEERSLAVHEIVMQKVYHETVANLIKFFNGSQEELEFPQELFAHIHVLNTYRIKNLDISAITLRCVAEEYKSEAYEYYQEDFMHKMKDYSNSLSSKCDSSLTVPKEKLTKYGVCLTNAFLQDNLDSDDIKKVVGYITRSILFGDIEIDPMMLIGEFDLILPAFNYHGRRTLDTNRFVRQADIEEIEECQTDMPPVKKQKLNNIPM